MLMEDLIWIYGIDAVENLRFLFLIQFSVSSAFASFQGQSLLLLITRLVLIDFLLGTL